MPGHEIRRKQVGIIWKFCSIFTLSVALSTCPATAQNLSLKAQSSPMGLQLTAEEGDIIAFGYAILPLSYWLATPLSLPTKKKLPYQQSIIRTDPAHAYKHLGVICKWEYRLEQVVQFPVKFRLGEYHYVQKLEGKSLHNDFRP
ncbi:hypothetical protein [Phaeodactylibacter xiamenensis]|uniref:hypothetical protein n=1 Tax=Phaeodactylibacter xiamenensis TaxID=1524460 RepID=UPI0024A9B981|nr:hypothetical protein [Phaeodactylibacter xiamenensis]